MPRPCGREFFSGSESGRGCFSDQLEGGVLEWGFRLSSLASTQKLRGGELPGVSAGDEITLENLDTGEHSTVHVSARGTFRVAVAADALPPIPRRALFGRADGDLRPMVVTPELAPKLAHRLRLTVRSATGELRGVVDRFPSELSFQGTVYPAGTPLCALQEGLGLRRNTPRLRRFLGFASMALGPADPATWAVRVREAPADHGYDPNTRLHTPHLLAMPTAGDAQVPVNTGIAMARSAGLLGSWRRDEGRFPAEAGWRELFASDADRTLLEGFVVEGDPRLQRFGADRLQPNVIYDVDDVSDGAASFSCGPSDWSASNGESGCPDSMRGQEIFFDVPRATPPLRAARALGDGSFDALRVPLLRPAGQHGIYNAQPFRRFDADAFMVNFTTRYLISRGRAVDHPAGCDCSASAVPEYVLGGAPVHPSLDRSCTAGDLKVCDARCTEAWGIRTRARVECAP